VTVYPSAADPPLCDVCVGDGVGFFVVLVQRLPAIPIFGDTFGVQATGAALK